MQGQALVSSQQAFAGWVAPSAVAPPSPSAGSLVLNVVPLGAIDGTNRVFAMPQNFTDISVYLNGVRLIRGADFTPLAAAAGPGYDRVRLTVAPDSTDEPDVLTADLVAA